MAQLFSRLSLVLDRRGGQGRFGDGGMRPPEWSELLGEAGGGKPWSWYRPQEILAHIAVIARPPWRPQASKGSGFDSWIASLRSQ